MPTYEYQCKKCTHNFEVFQQITEEPLRICPVCGGAVQRIISAGAGFIFKGSGFYATDYRSKEYKDRQQQEAKANGSTSAVSKNKEAAKKCPADKNKDD